MTPAGTCFVDPLLANTAKLNITRFIYEICRLAHDISGGLLGTAPSEKDLNHPVVGRYVRKYFGGTREAPAEARLRVARLIESMSSSSALLESMHGAGSPQVLRIGITRQANFPERINMAKAILGEGVP